MLIFFICFLSLFFVASTSNGHRLELNYNLQYVFNEKTYMIIFIVFFVYLFHRLKFRLSKFDYFFLVFLCLFFNFNLIRWLTVEPAFGYVIVLLFLFPLMKNLSSAIVLSFVRINLILLSIFLIIKITDLYFGLRLSPFIDSEYFAAGTAVSESGIYRFSNSLIFGQRNLAGGYLSSIVILYTCYVHLNQRNSLPIYYLLFILILSTFSVTALLIFLLSLFYLYLKKFNLFKVVLLIVLFALIFAYVGFDRKLDSFLVKINTFNNFYNSLSVLNLFFGNFSINNVRPYFESALLDMIYDLGILPIFIIFVYPIISLFNHTNYSLKFFVLFSYFLIFSFSNSTISPPVVIVFMLTFSFIGRSHVKKDNIQA